MPSRHREVPSRPPLLPATVRIMEPPDRDDDPVHPDPDDEPAAGNGHRRARVLYVGLQGQQMNHVRGELGSELDLRFLESSDSHQRMTQRAAWADYTLAMTDWIDHSAQDALRRGNCPDFRRVQGSASNAVRVGRQIIVDWRVRQMQGEAK